jgi:hypothetical protein
LSEGSCLGPAAAFAEEGAVVFSSEAPNVPTGLFETLPVNMDEGTSVRLLDRVRAILPRVQVAIRGSSATGVKWETGDPLDEASDIDLAIVDDGLFQKAQELGIKFRGDGTRTGPLKLLQLRDLGLEELANELAEVAGYKVSIMVYRSMDDVLARGPAVIFPEP